MDSMFNTIKNEMKSLESESDKSIEPENYYLMNITLSGKEISFPQMKKWGLKFFKRTPSPVCIYIYLSTMFLIFSCCEENTDHYLGGSHHRLVSHYTNEMGLLCKNNTLSIFTCIVEFSTKVQVLTYLSYRVYSNNISCISKLLDHETGSKTRKELLDQLKKNGCEWEKLGNVEKYGIFFRLNSKKGKNGCVFTIRIA